MTPPSPKRNRPRHHLVVHDIQFESKSQADGSDKLSAYVDCERRGRRIALDECRACERLDRIDSHEAGYVVLCRSEDETFDADA